MGEVFWTSDTHFGHKNLMKYRSFDDVEEMNDFLIDAWNRVVTPRDMVYHLGDVGFGESIGRCLSRLKGFIILIKGNHDHSKDFKRYVDPHRIYEEHEILVWKKSPFKKPLTMLHYPMISWPQSDYGSIHFHGHCHGQLPHDMTKRRFDVGVDTRVDMAPYSFDELKEMCDAVNFERV